VHHCETVTRTALFRADDRGFNGKPGAVEGLDPVFVDADINRGADGDLDPGAVDRKPGKTGFGKVHGIIKRNGCVLHAAHENGSELRNSGRERNAHAFSGTFGDGDPGKTGRRRKNKNSKNFQGISFFFEEPLRMRW